MRPEKENPKIRRSLSKRWYNLIDRCENSDHPRYKDYGGSGVKVADEWKDKENFIRTAKTLSGYDEDLLLSGKLHLDKDTLIPGNKLYSPNTCVFISSEENNKHKPNQMRRTIGIAPDGRRYEFTNRSEFSKIHKLNNSTIGDCLSGRVKVHRGWTFKYAE